MKKDLFFLLALSVVYSMVITVESVVLPNLEKLSIVVWAVENFYPKKVLPLTWKYFIDFYNLVKGKTNRELLTEQKEIDRKTGTMSIFEGWFS